MASESFLPTQENVDDDKFGQGLEIRSPEGLRRVCDEAAQHDGVVGERRRAADHRDVDADVSASEAAKV